MANATGTKEKISITIDKDLLSSIDNECDETRKRSPVLEYYIRKGMAVKELEIQVKALKAKIRNVIKTA